MTEKNYYLRKLLILTTLGVLAGPVPTAQARYAEIDSVFLNRRVAEIESLSDSLISATRSRHEIYDHILKVLETRRIGLEELGSRLSLTSFDGIETQDEYGKHVLYAVGRLLETAQAMPHLPIGHEDQSRFNEEMGVVPNLGYAPAPYLVIAAIEAVAQRTGSVESATNLPREIVSSLSLDVFAQAYRQLTTDMTDDITATRVDQVRQDTVAERLRCPKDGSNYRVRQILNKLFADETFATQWFLRCNICYQDREIWFPHTYLQKLAKAEKEQNLTKPPKKLDPNAGLEP